MLMRGRIPESLSAKSGDSNAHAPQAGHRREPWSTSSGAQTPNLTLAFPIARLLITSTGRGRTLVPTLVSTYYLGSMRGRSKADPGSVDRSVIGACCTR